MQLFDLSLLICSGPFFNYFNYYFFGRFYKNASLCFVSINLLGPSFFEKKLF